MNKFKAAVAILVFAGIPVALALTFAGLGLGFANQHVHDVTAVLEGSRAVVKVNDFDHSTGGIVAAAGGLAVAWAMLSALAILAGGKMYSSRNSSWD